MHMVQESDDVTSPSSAIAGTVTAPSAVAAKGHAGDCKPLGGCYIFSLSTPADVY